MRQFRIVLISTFLFAAAASAQQLQVRLEASPATTLPGVPVSLRVTFTNPSSAPIALPVAGVLMAERKGEAPFPALWEWRPHVSFKGEEKEVGRVPVVREFEADGQFGSPAWFYNNQFTRPGVYQLQLYVVDFIGVDESYQKTLKKAKAISNPVTLTVTVPEGPDAAVWNALVAHSMGSPGSTGWKANDILHGDGPALAQRLLREYPESAYAGWLLTMGTSGTPRDAARPADELRDWLARHPQDPYYEQRMLWVAEWETQMAFRDRQTDPASSKLHEKKARDAYAKLAKARSQAVQARVKKRLEDMEDLSF